MGVPSRTSAPTPALDQNDGLRIILGKVRPFTSPRRVPSTGSDHCSEAPDDFVYTALQIALREAVSRRSLDDLLQARAALSDEIVEPARATAQTVGVALDSLAVRDVMIPSELRRAAADVATARAQGLASLERARSEVAATRALANAARTLSQQPGLLQLRTLQAIEAGNATVVLHTEGYAPASAGGGDPSA
jgi:regulator of protease activity HflC (stomatin/prohibitin superfamily)